jgi:hypothetical protein
MMPNLPASFRRILEAAQSAGLPVEPWGEDAVLVGAKRGRGGKFLRGVVLWYNGYAQDVTVSLTAARMFRAKEAYNLLGLSDKAVQQ